MLETRQAARIVGGEGGTVFKELLEEMVTRADGSMAGVVMGFDGIPIEQFVAQGAELDPAQVGMEYSVILKDIRRAAGMLEAGAAREVAIQAERMATVIRLINDEYFVALTLRPDGNMGKARYLLRLRASELETALK